MKNGGFHFGVPVEIAGKTYYIDLNRDGAQEKIQTYYRQAVDEAARAEAVENYTDREFLLTHTKELVDAILGDGSFDDIFSGRIIAGYDVAGVLRYLADEAKKEAAKIRKWSGEK